MSRAQLVLMSDYKQKETTRRCVLLKFVTVTGIYGRDMEPSQ